jgi:hypothetical protein
MKCDIFHVLHPLTFVKTARSGLSASTSSHSQRSPAAFARLDGAKYLLAVAWPVVSGSR